MRLLVAGLVIISVAWRCAGQSSTYIDVAKIVKDTKRGEKGEPTLGLLTQRNELIKRLIEIVDNGTNEPDVRITAALLLGHLRSSEASSILIQNLLLGPAYGHVRGFETACPLGYALSLIGSPARDGILDRLGAADNAQERKMLLEVLSRIEGYEVGQFLLAGRMRQSEGKQRDRLSESLKLFIEEWRHLLEQEEYNRKVNDRGQPLESKP